MRPSSAGVGDSLILIVGGDRDQRAILAEILSEEGYQISQVASAPEAFEEMRRTPPWLVLLNTLSPVAEWTKFVASIKAVEPAPRVIVLTAYGDRPDVREALFPLGVRRIISKPYQTKELLAAISEEVE